MPGQPQILCQQANRKAKEVNFRTINWTTNSWFSFQYKGTYSPGPIDPKREQYSLREQYSCTMRAYKTPYLINCL
jgi:hypothetical protein